MSARDEAIQMAWAAHLRAPRPSTNAPVDNEYEALVAGFEAAEDRIVEMIQEGQ